MELLEGEGGLGSGGHGQADGGMAIGSCMLAIRRNSSSYSATRSGCGSVPCKPLSGRPGLPSALPSDHDEFRCHDGRIGAELGLTDPDGHNATVPEVGDARERAVAPDHLGGRSRA
jgi:hypothetical protein